MQELVSIIMPIYNSEKYIEITLKSIRDQTYKNWELLATNDGSKDNSEEILKEYSEKDSRIKYFNQKNGGSAKARNNSLKKAIGRFIVYLDSDDIWDQDFLEKQIKFLQDKKVNIVSGSYRRINEKGEEILTPFIVPKETNYNKLLKSCTMTCLTTIYDTQKIKKVYFNEALGSYRDDYVMWLKLLKSGNKVYGNSEVLASYRVFKGSVTGNKLKIIKPHFNVYYKEEKIGILKSIYYFLYWIYLSLKKY
ncbi:MAG: glycosyltransferase family 2 protein [Psychrilyobacter sp.]|uniref:glycosyltransferase family 2 protein n=1 Tax=Psychrilyobacter sp. TaxID=2586924 RepID=UPI003C742FF8